MSRSNGRVKTQPLRFEQDIYSFYSLLLPSTDTGTELGVQGAEAQHTVPLH